MITDPLAQLLRRVEELERHTRHIDYQGTVTDVDALRDKRISQIRPRSTRSSLVQE
jgi:hypothetical protein